MSKEKESFPAYRRRVDRGRAYAVVTLADGRTKRRRTYRLGCYGTDRSRELYTRLIAEWEASGRCLPARQFNGDHDSA